MSEEICNFVTDKNSGDLKKQEIYICLFLLLLFLSACSVRKNNWATRNYHALVTHYNIYFNGNESYKEGIKKLNEEARDDYSKLLPLYPIGIPDNGKSVEGEMNKTIEKCRKAIKLHSIQKKPKIDRKKAKDAKYQAFLKKEEYNSQLKYAWMLQGKAELHKGDFMGAVATFSYIMRHYSTEPDVVLEAKIWQARAYAEMGWLYEAEEVLAKVNPNEVGYKLLALYEGANADLFLKQKRYEEAVPFLKSAVEHERTKTQRTRNLYVLAQVYQMLGNEKEANNCFRQVMKTASSYTMNFNAQINSAQLAAAGDSKKVLKSLKKMAKDVRNKEFLDQIYFAQGNVYLKNGDESSAIDAYKKAVESSTRNGIEKATAEIKLADLYYDKRNYLEAQPCYSDASQILTTEHEEYRRVSNRAEVLSELSVDYQTVVLQDSLQRIALMPEDEQLAFIEKVIENVIKEEELLRQKEEEDAYAAQRAAANTSTLPNFQASSTDWYFYNTNLINKGKSEFVRKWGNRRLEDNWRRQNKMAVVDETENMYADNSDDESTDSGQSNITDNKKPEYYLNQLPNTPAKLKQSNEMIANSLFNLGYIYSLKLEDDEMALDAFGQLQKLFPEHEKIADSYFYSYQIAKKRGDEVLAQHYSSLILKQFPQSSFAHILSQSDYVSTMSDMFQKQDSLYEATYKAYTIGNFEEVKNNYHYMNEHYQVSALMPKFAFLNAMSIGKTQPAETFKLALERLVELYPQSDVTSMSKDILALMGQGKEAQQGSSHGTLLTRREVETEEKQSETNTEQAFQPETAVPFMIVFEVKGAQAVANVFMYDLAAFNFSKFLIKDFDLKIVKRSEDVHWLVVSGLENLKDAQWYFKTIDAENSLHLHIVQSNYLFISEDNYNLLGTPNFGWDDYLDFYRKNIITQKK